MEYKDALLSGSSPKIRKAANAIFKHAHEGYCAELTAALNAVIENPRSWETQCAVIRAFRAIGCIEALPKLKKLLEKNFKATRVYKELAYSIAILDGMSAENLEFFYSSIETKNVLQISGVCSAMIEKEIIPDKTDIRKIIAAVSEYTHLEGGGGQEPRAFIASVAYLWPKEETETFLKSCLSSPSKTLVSIATDSLQGKKTNIII